MLEKYEETLEFNRFGIIAFLIVFVSALGGIAAGGVMDNLPMLALVAGTTMLMESMILAVQPMKWIISTAALSVLVSIVALFMSL